MNSYHIDTHSMEKTIKDWGVITNLMNKTSLGVATDFSLSLISYAKDHFSGTHEFTELLYVTQGEGTANVGNQTLPIVKGSLVVIPAGVEHGITKVDVGPIEVVVLHLR